MPAEASGFLITCSDVGRGGEGGLKVAGSQTSKKSLNLYYKESCSQYSQCKGHCPGQCEATGPTGSVYMILGLALKPLSGTDTRRRAVDLGVDLGVAASEAPHVPGQTRGGAVGGGNR